LLLKNTDVLQNKKIVSILAWRDNNTVFITDKDGIFIYDGKNTKKFETKFESLLKNSIAFSADINNNTIAIGTVLNGVMLVNLENQRTQHFNIQKGLQNNTVLSVKFDNTNNLWLGLDRGIDYIILRSPLHTMFKDYRAYGSGYCSLKKSNTIYFGTNQGLFSTTIPGIDSNNKHQITNVNGIKGQVWSIDEIHGTIFCSTDKGLYIVDGNNAQKINKTKGTWSVKAMSKRNDIIIGSSYNGFFVLHRIGDSWEYKHDIQGHSHSEAAFETDENSIWMSHWLNGIKRFELNEDLSQIKKIHNIKLDSLNLEKRFYKITKFNDIIYITTNDGFWIKENNNEFRKCVRLSNLFGNATTASSLFFSPYGHIVCMTDSKVKVAATGKDNLLTVDSISFNLISTKTIPGFEHISFIDSTFAIFSTNDGFILANLKFKNGEKGNFKLNLTATIRGTNETFAVSRNSFNKAKKIKYKNNSVLFEFVAPEFRANNTVDYYYMLENKDAAWRKVPNNQLFKEYESLKPGSYTFKVMAKNSLENTIAEQRINFIIQPPLVLSKQAIILYFVIIVIAIFLIYKFTTYRFQNLIIVLKQRNFKQILEQQKKFEEERLLNEQKLNELTRNKLEIELRNKSFDLANSTMNLAQKNEVLISVNNHLDKILNDIQNIEPKGSGSLKKQIKALKNEIDNNLANENYWDKLQENFDIVYDNYFQRLSQTYPNLTLNDKKICAYLKLNLSSKEIAPLLNISYRSVEMLRYRLRKKLELDREVNLTDFLQSF
jgi:DNA-binding CsgD family transcriptional regulator